MVACGKSETPAVPPVAPNTQPADAAVPQAVPAPSADKQATPEEPALAKTPDTKSAPVDSKKSAEVSKQNDKITAKTVAPEASNQVIEKAEPVAPSAQAATEKKAGTDVQAVVDMPELAKKNGCIACHKIDAKLIGPAWRDVAKKYKGATEYAYSSKGSAAPDAQKFPLVEGLMIKVSRGGSGNWGTAAMIANDPKGKKQDQIKELVEFVLGLEK